MSVACVQDVLYPTLFGVFCFAVFYVTAWAMRQMTDKKHDRLSLHPRDLAERVASVCKMADRVANVPIDVSGLIIGERRERDLLAEALRAVVRANDSIDGALGDIRETAGPEAAEVARRALAAEVAS